MFRLPNAELLYHALLIYSFISVNPSTCIAWYPTRYDANLLFGEERKRTDENHISHTAIMAIFAENDKLPGSTTEDAAKLKTCLEADNRVKDYMVKVSSILFDYYQIHNIIPKLFV